MKRLRCLNSRQDNLHIWAEHWVNTATMKSMVPEPEKMADYGNVSTAILDRDGAYQVELCVLQGGVVVPLHTHPRMNSIEIGLAGGTRFTLNGRAVLGDLSDEKLIRFITGRGLRFNSDDVHGGVVLKCGAMFLSIQHWHTGEPTSVALDYQGEPFSDVHSKSLK